MSGRLIDRWFPVAAVDEACGTPAGSGQNEKAIFTWFASRPIAQARAAVLCSLIPEDREDPDPATIALVEEAIRTGDHNALASLAAHIPDVDGKRPVVLDCFSGRGIIPLEAARLGLRAIGIDNSPVAALASRLLADFALRDWSAEPQVKFSNSSMSESSESLFNVDGDEAKLVSDLRSVFGEIDRRVGVALADRYPASADGTIPWGHLWAVTIPCDSCGLRFPLVGSLVLRYPVSVQGDLGQSLEIHVDTTSGIWRPAVVDGVTEQKPTYRAPEGRRGKSGWCPFCGHQHPLATIKAKGFAGEYEDVPLLVGEIGAVSVTTTTAGRTRKIDRKTFRTLTASELSAALVSPADIDVLPPIGGLSAVPDEPIAPGNASTVDASGYGFMSWASLMNRRQAVLFAETARAIRSVVHDIPGVSDDYRAALASFASANLVRRLRRATRGCGLLAYRDRPAVGVTDVFANESGVNFALDWFETGLGDGPGSWQSLTTSMLRALDKHVRGLSDIARSGQFRRASATSAPYRDSTVDAVVCDPPYYEMINYADVSDLFYVWLRRCLSDVVPDLFEDAGDSSGLQDKSDEIVVKQGRAPDDHRTVDWYERRMSAAFREMRRILKPEGPLTVVFGHSDPEAWRRLLGALRDAGFVVTSAWPARTESGSTGVASIKVTVTIGCQVAALDRPTATAAQVEREIAELIRRRVSKWDEWNLALSDQRMAAYGPAMQVVGRYRSILRPDGTEPDLDHFLTVGRKAVAEAHSFKIDELPLDTFDAFTRFALFWLRAYGRTTVNKGEARFEAQSAEQRIEDLRGPVLTESNSGFTITLDDPGPVTDRSPVIAVARALASAWPASGTEGAAEVVVDSGREPDDAHLWATVAELVRRLPESSDIGKALTACQRNRNAITATARRARQGIDDASRQLSVDFTGEFE